MKSILCILLFVSLYIPCTSQSVVASAGQSGSNGSIQASATVGEAIIGSGTAAGLMANQGFQQPLANDLSTSIFDPLGQLVEVVLSPNPALENVQLYFSCDMSDLQVWMYSSAGQLVGMHQFEGPRSAVVFGVGHLESGSYYIHIVNQHGHHLGTLPLIKI